MIAVEWLQGLVLDGWQFWMDEGRLRYRAPKDAAAPAVLDRLRALRNEIQDLLLRTPDALAIGPLSYGQRALWFLWRLAPESSAYNQSLPLDIRTAADAAAWRKAARILVRRHPMLRTRFPVSRGEPMQQTLSAPTLDWREDGGAPPAESHARPFDLEAAPPVRFHWFSLGGGAARLLMTMHHIVCDAWSLEIIRRELGAIAATLAAGQEWTSPPPSHTYLDFVRWQRALLSSPAGERLWTFWREQLAEPRAPLDLPSDRPRPPVASYRGESVKLDLPAALARRLHDLARSRDVTRHALLLAAFLAALHRWTRQRDLIVGIPSAGRSQPEFAPVVGYFVEPIVLRVKVDEEMRFADLLAAVKKANHAAFAHADYPFALLVERLRVVRDASRSPLFDVTFNFLSRRAAAASAGEAPAPAVFDIPQADGKFDLTLTVMDDDDAMEAAIGFNSDLFDRATIERTAGNLVRLLEAIAGDPEQRLDALPFDVAPAIQPALRGRPTDIAALQSVPDRIDASTRQRSGATAVVAADGSLTYAELARRASDLAARLSNAGVRTGEPVGLCTARSTEFLVGLLGIWEAGAAYVPLDPALPPVLRGEMLDLVGAKTCVMGRWLEPQPPRWQGRLVDAVESDSVSPHERAPVLHASPAADLDRLAYIIFTSGSTGRPKGVAIEHRALSNYVASIVEDLQIEPGARHALVSTIGADLGHTAIFPALVTGGTLHVLPEETLGDRGLFARYLSEQEIDYLKIVPSHLAALVDERAPVLPRRAVFLGGESSSSAWVAQLQHRTGCRFFNHYGPTETTVGVLSSAFDPAAPPATGVLPLDRAVANCDIWLLDERGRPVPPGVPGEIVVTGPALARGYFGDPVQTAERFVQAPDGARAYRTGDLARLSPEGRIEILGRVDRQLKLRGYRVEPGQVERALLGHPAIGQAVVLPDADGARASHLVGFVTAKSESEPPPDEAALRVWLAERMPHYMVPARLTIVDRVPLTSNGKVDAAALRSAVPAAATVESQRAAVHDLVELRLCRIWSRVLGVEHVRPTDDFFQLGGHSLLAVRLASLVADEFGQRLPLATLLTHRTVEQLAAMIREASARDTAAASIVPMQTGGDRPPLILFPGAGGSLLYFQHLLAALDPDLPVWGAQMPGLGGDGPIAVDIPSLAATYADCIERRWSSADAVHLAGHSFGGLIAFEVARHLRKRGRDVAFVGVFDNPAPQREPSDLGAESGAGGRDWLRHIATRIERLYGVDLGLRGENVDGDNAPAENDWLVDRLLAAGVLPPGVSRTYFARWVELYRASVAAAHEYNPGGPLLDVPIALFTAADADAALERPRVDDGTLGWQAYSALPVQVVDIPGTHITMLTEPHVRTLGERLRAFSQRTTDGAMNGRLE